MRITILGAGGVGGTIAARLSAAGRPVGLIARGAHLEAIRERGLELRLPDETLQVRQHLTATSDPAELGHADLLIVAVKAYDLDAAIDSVRPCIGPATAILPLQNGVEAADQIRAKVPYALVLGGVARVVSSIVSPGVVQSSKVLHLVVGAFDPADAPRARAAAEALRVDGLKVVDSDDIQAALWAKFLFICGYSGMACLVRGPIGQVIAHPEGREVFEGVMREVEAIGRARGVKLPPNVVEEQLANAMRLAPGSPSSMLVDLERGHRLELDALNGAAVRLGRESGVPTPANTAIVAALRPWALGRSHALERS